MNTETDDTENVKDWEVKCVDLENKLNECILITNKLIHNVNASNMFIADLHNSLAQAGMIKSPEEIVNDIKNDNIPEGAKKLLETAISEEPEPEPEMVEVN